MLIVVISGVFLLLYCAQVLIFIFGFRRIECFEKGCVEINCRPTIIVACKNEEGNLPNLFCALRKQTHKNFDVIFVNDHSTDQTENLLQAFKNEFANVSVIHATGNGKKNAVKEGVLAATTDFIITTDSDCVPVSTWIETICKYQTYLPSDLIICPIIIRKSKGLFNKLQQLEFTTLVASGAGMAGVGMPIMCNAANMAFRKSAWVESETDLHEELLSGDDVFLLTSIKKRKGSIRFLKSVQALVETNPSPTISSFVNQRKRWASKSGAYNDAQLIITAIIVFGINFGLVYLLLLSAFSSSFATLFFVIYLLKLVVDFIFCAEMYRFFPQRSLLFYVFLLSIIYPFYIVFTSISSFLQRSKSW